MQKNLEKQERYFALKTKLNRAIKTNFGLKLV